MSIWWCFLLFRNRTGFCKFKWIKNIFLWESTLFWGWCLSNESFGSGHCLIKSADELNAPSLRKACVSLCDSFLFPGKLWSRSLKLAYTLLNKLGTKNEPVLKPGDRVISFLVLRRWCFIVFYMHILDF